MRPAAALQPRGTACRFSYFGTKWPHAHRRRHRPEEPAGCGACTRAAGDRCRAQAWPRHRLPHAGHDGTPVRRSRPGSANGLRREQEEALARLAASGDLRPSRWARAGDPTLLAGVATMLASQPEFDRAKLLALAERLCPGMSTTPVFGRWLRTCPVRASRFLPMVRAELRQRGR
jgi:hypothetical protein